MIVPLPLFRESLAPKMIGLLFCAPDTELHQAGKNFLQNTLGPVPGRGHFPLGLYKTTHNQPDNKEINKPDKHSDSRQLHAVITHQRQTPEGKKETEDHADDFFGKQMYHLFQTQNTAGQFAGLQGTEKLHRQA